MAELSVAFSPPSLRLRGALLATHPRPSGRGILAKESKKGERAKGQRVALDIYLLFAIGHLPFAQSNASYYSESHRG